MQQASFISSSRTLGILGGGQLGKMLLQCTRTWDIRTQVLDPDAEAPARLSCDTFVQGSLQDYDTVMQFGATCDVLTIEIEHVNTRALYDLQAKGVIVHPEPKALEMIQDKGLQKCFFQAHDLPTAAFTLYDTKEEILVAIEQGKLQYPFVQKSRKGGYDGKGVQVIRHAGELNRLMDTPSVVEDCIAVKEELAVVACRNADGQVRCYDAVRMDFVEGANLLDVLEFPAPVSTDLIQLAQQLATQLISQLPLCGLLAVEFLIDGDNHIFINEVAPRPHNSGHQTIESCITSQYEQHIRGILNWPLGSTAILAPSVMINLLGEEGYAGPAYYENLEACLNEAGVHIHIYGKKQTRPFRKMGHVTVTASTLGEAKNKALWVKRTLKVKSLL